MKKNAKPGSAEDFEFFVTTGDNLYPSLPEDPTEEEIQRMMDLFLTRKQIKDIPIYPVRGNHDCYFKDNDEEVKMSQKYPTWKMPSNYYEKQFEIGPNGEKFSLLQVDSCYLLCETVSKNPNKYLHLLDLHSQEIYLSKCEGDTPYVKHGNDMMKWIDKVTQYDPKVLWKASSMHHPMFGLHY